MERFTVRLAPGTEDEIRESFEWGAENWGEVAAQKWVRELHATIFERVSIFPERFPIAPDVDLPDREVRHLIFNRYRILFNIRGSDILILHVRDPHKGY